MASDLPRIRVHDDGRIAVPYPGYERKPDEVDWFVIALNEHPDHSQGRYWAGDEDVTGPGWRDAAIVPLPEPATDGQGRPAWREGRVHVVLQPWDERPLMVRDNGYDAADARQLAAALLAAADHLDRRQAEAVSTDGR